MYLYSSHSSSALTEFIELALFVRGGTTVLRFTFFQIWSNSYDSARKHLKLILLCGFVSHTPSHTGQSQMASYLQSILEL